jgi:hypothetical protein
MRPTTLALLVLLLASNLAWWLFGQTRAESTVVPAPAAPVARNVAAPADEVPGTAALQSELERAKARIAELEAAAATRRTRPAPAAPTEPSAAVQAEAAERAAAMERSQAAHRLSRQWSEAGLQTLDVRKRMETLDTIRAALAGNDPVLVHAALLTLARLRELDYDKASFRPLVLPSLQAKQGAIRAAALSALCNTALEPADLTTFAAMVDDESAEVRGAVAFAVRRTQTGVIDGEAADALLRLLADTDHHVRHSALNSLSGIRVDARLEAALLAGANDRTDPETRRRTIRFGLSNVDGKSPRVVATLLEAIDDADDELASSARMALRFGVGKAERAQVADAIVRLLETRDSAGVAQECDHLLRLHGSAKQVPALEALAARPGMPQVRRTQLAELIAMLRTR